ncbi:MAG: hypothetical protein IT204_13065 [Fimbriimonadaceae bacterium]|nr:hypothetical protein [Fimbriimonadaceae bacterium]
MFAGLPRAGNVLFAPVLHYRLEFADAVRRVIAQWQPTALVVELPATLEPAIRRAVARLPQLSVVAYLDRQGQPVYLPLEPCEALLEAVRSGQERGLPVIFGDLDLDSYPLYDDPFPDSYVLTRLGWGQLWEAYAARRARAVDPADVSRETNLAWHLQQLADQPRVLCVCGFQHVAGILQGLARPLVQPLARQQRAGVQVFNLHPDSVRGLLATPPFVAAVYERRRHELPPRLPPLPVAARQHQSGLRLVSGGRDNLGHQEYERARLQIDLAWRAAPAADHLSPLDRQKVLLGLMQAARRQYEEHTGEQLRTSDLGIWRRFCRNWALLDGLLLPDLHQLVIGARGIADDNLAFETWDLGSHWPWQQESAELTTIRLNPEEVWQSSRRIQFRPRPPRDKARLRGVRLKERRHERRPGEWRREFLRGGGICSYPPEDIVIEGFGEHLKKRAKHQLAEDDARVEPFRTSLLDGIDVRETVRNWHQRQLFVRELRRTRGEVGSVVVIFDEDEADRRYPWRMTWLGEHSQESDMAFYATAADGRIIGPGIARCEYGGFMMSYPPGRMHEVWEDRAYRGVLRKSEVLLLAALDYSEQRHVVYVAAKPPRPLLRQWAGRLGRQILYLPLGGFSPVTLQKLRVFHVLSGHDKRAAARDYIW